jgi:GNAT superfamily N-acetyltransferase
MQQSSVEWPAAPAAPPPVEARRGAYVVSTDPTRLDLAAVHRYLARSYWSPGIPEDVVRRAAAHSLTCGLYHDTAHGAEQVGYARAVTDRATFAYLADVYVLEAHRGRGLGAWLVGTLLSHAALQGLRRTALMTRDAHRLYARFGFRPAARPESYMERVVPNAYGAAAAPASPTAEV